MIGFVEAHSRLPKILSSREILQERQRHEAGLPSLLKRSENPPLIEFLSPAQLAAYVPPEGAQLVGDYHIMRGSVFVIGGAPGVGKSRASVALAEAGAKQRDWFGLCVHRQFKTMIIQNENGTCRLSREFQDLDYKALEGWVAICPPPPCGLCFDRGEFREQLVREIEKFQPDIIILDPWNSVARDDKAREYLETIACIREVIPAGDKAPALGIVAHTKKPKSDERATGRGLLNLLAGSYVLGSFPRSVFVMQAASDDPQDNGIVWTCCKNNDGELGERSAWERRNGLFAPVESFDWENFDHAETGSRISISASNLASIFKGNSLTLAEAAKALISLTGASRASCYNALKLDGRFAKNIKAKGKKLTWQA